MAWDSRADYPVGSNSFDRFNPALPTSFDHRYLYNYCWPNKFGPTGLA
jgi:hypothetical protein